MPARASNQARAHADLNFAPPPLKLPFTHLFLEIFWHTNNLVSGIFLDYRKGAEMRLKR